MQKVTVIYSFINAHYQVVNSHSSIDVHGLNKFSLPLFENEHDVYKHGQFSLFEAFDIYQVQLCHSRRITRKR